ncbi:Oxidative stress-induced growth inhibitor 1 [Operophtera brumata]|uniref:Oxidative stress-induced growth inhibitor 1 n=1 Tax=Operophtera brumata TaxID=104452 RepID=A0A0L7KYK8_OPEBR|nr:Oxidative stress-induced growth inhibitor 1 [Operophtera brumata]
MMCDGPSGNHENYTPYPHHVIVDLLNLHTNETTEILVSTIGVFIGSKPDLFFLQTNFDLNCIDLKSCNCLQTKKIEEKRFFKNHWLYFKNVLQSIQNCKSRYFFNDTCSCEENCKCDVIPYSEVIENKINCHCQSDIKCQCQSEVSCQCQSVAPLTNGIGFGIDSSKPVDSRNPIAIDKSTHELLNTPKGIYALGPLTADNFVRFIPGGALALVAHIHSDSE